MNRTDAIRTNLETRSTMTSHDYDQRKPIAVAGSRTPSGLSFILSGAYKGYHRVGLRRISSVHCPLYKVMLLTCASLFSLLAAADARSDQPKRIRVGVIVGLTGAAAPNGAGLKNGITLADTEWDKSDRVDFIFEDDNFQAKNSVTAAHKLISEDQVSALITFSGSTSLAVSEISESRAIPHIAITPLSKVSAHKKFVRTVFVPNSTAVALLSEAIKRPQEGRIAIITSTQDALLQIRERMRTSLGARVVFDEEVRPGDLDLLGTITRLLANKPNVVVNLTLPPQISHVARILRDRHFQGQQVGAPPMYNYNEIKASAGALIGAQLTGPRIPVGSHFITDYKTRFQDPVLPEAIFGYDTARWIIEACHKPNGLAHILTSDRLSGLAGEYLRDLDNQFEVPGELKVITERSEIATAVQRPGADL